MLIGLLIPASVALAAKMSSHVAAERLATQGGFPARYFAPYVEVMPDPSVAYTADQIGQVEQQTGIKYFQLAFILGQGCKAVWGGDAVLSPSPDPIMAVINQIRSIGGDVSITFGGAAAPELAQSCTDLTSLQKQYQTVIDTYHVTHIDFDLESAAVADAFVGPRNQVLAALQKANPGLAISYTLPVTPDGLTADAMNLLKDAVSKGITVSLVDIMAMDYYGGAKSSEEGDNAISAAQATEKQLSSIGLSSAKLGITPMIGRNDDAAENFTVDDANKLVTFAKQDPKIVELSMWAVNRDRSCSGQFTALSDCSFATQQQYDFAKAFSQFPDGPLKPTPLSPGPQPTSQPQPPATPEALVPQPPATPEALVPQPPPGAVVPPPQIWSFPCSDIQGPAGRLQPNENAISIDWLSGNDPIVSQDSAATVVHGGGRLFYTYDTDTEHLPQITALFGIMQEFGFFLIIPSMLLLGYQFMLGASTFRYAGAVEGLSRILLGAVAVAVSFELIDTLISIENNFTAAIITLHGEHPFPIILINGKPIPYRLAGDPLMSYRGVVMPMSRWGCAINDFIGVVSASFLTNTIGSMIPLIGGLAPLAGHVTNVTNLIQRCNELVLAILSFLVWVQVLMRILLLNYYILMTPLAFGCWALPGGVGQRVVHLWFKGFFTALFVQVAQLFVLTTLPLLLPPPPQIFADKLGIMQGLLLQFPLMLTLCAMLMTPRVLGASVGKALGTAGSMAGGTIVAVGTVTSRAR
jgi:chitinase